METIIIFIKLCFLFYPIYILGREEKSLVSARLPRIIPILRMLLLNPYKEFKKIAIKSYDNKYYKFHYSPSTQAQESWYERQLEYGNSRRIGWRNTLLIANRILEFRLWLTIRSCKNYDELKIKAILIITETRDEGFVFVSSALYSHSKGIKGGVKELRKIIIESAEEHQGLVFNQIPFLDLYLPYLRGNEKGNKFELFYEPIIESSQITKVIMNNGWEKSMGCRTEHEVASKNLKKIEYCIK